MVLRTTNSRQINKFQPSKQSTVVKNEAKAFISKSNKAMSESQKGVRNKAGLSKPPSRLLQLLSSISSHLRNFSTYQIFESNLNI
jgi:hypothetical protein